MRVASQNAQPCAREPLNNVGGETLVRASLGKAPHKKQSLHAVNEHFFGGRLVKIQRCPGEHGNFLEAPQHTSQKNSTELSDRTIYPQQ